MSLKEWKSMYYPVEASTITNEKDALIHSYKKWLGLRPHVLKKYNIIHKLHSTALFYNSTKEGGFYIHDTSCALCQIYLYNDINTTCIECPLYKIREERCYKLNGSIFNSPYHKFIDNDDPTDMINLLKNAIKKYARIHEGKKYDNK
jgi:hypothetical protein